VKKKELEGFVIAHVGEYFSYTGFSYPTRRIIEIEFTVDDPRCTFKKIRNTNGENTYQFTKTTRKVGPIYVTIRISSRSFKKRDLLKDINGKVFADSYFIYWLGRRPGVPTRHCHLLLSTEKNEYTIGGAVTWTTKYDLKLMAKDIKDPGSILRYLLKTTEEKLAR